MQTFLVQQIHDGQRIDAVLRELLKAYSRSSVQRMVREGQVKINGKTAKKGNRVAEGDQVDVRKAILKTSRFVPADIPLDILFEDEDLLVINKPAGLLTHPSSQERQQTLVNALLHHCGDRLSGIGGERRPGIVHRLDKDTSGILLVAKHDESHRDLARQFQERKIDKRYQALVAGTFREKSGTIEAPLTKTRGKKSAMTRVSSSPYARNSITHFRVQKTFEKAYCLLEVHLITGRMHQIRVHLATIHHPVVGDPLYGQKKINARFNELGLHRQFLHAWKLKFHHPRTQELMAFEAPLPPDLQGILEALEAHS